MATKIISSTNHVHTQMMKMKLPKSVSRKTRAQSSSSLDSAIPSPCSVLPDNLKANKKRQRPLSPEPLQKEVKKMKVVESSSPTTPLSPEELRVAIVRVKHAHIIFKALKEDLEKRMSDPVELREALEQVRRKQREEKKRVETQQREEQRMADFEAKRKEEEAEKERLEMIQQQRRSQRLALERIEAVAKSKLHKPYCCTLKEFGTIARCDSSWCCGCWGGQPPLPLQQLGFINEEGKTDLQQGVIEDELEEGEIR